MDRGSRCIAVVGAHRTGSSLVAHILIKLGVHMGSKLLGRSPGNEEGFYEDLSFLALHKQIVGDWRAPNVNFEPYQKSYTRLIRARERQHNLWGLKDPRLCFAFPHFVRALQRSTELRVIHPTRDVAKCALSLLRKAEREKQKHTQVDPKQALYLAQLYTDVSLEVLADWGGPVLDVPYESLVNNPRYWVGQIANFIGVDPIDEAVEVVKPEMRHI
jgi:hypothetical protein